MVLLGSFSGDYQDDVDTGQGSDVATDLESIRTVMNGLLDDANIKPGAAINQSKVAGLTTAVAKLDSAHQGENHTGDVTSVGLVTTIATNAVTETKIAANAVTEAKIGALAVTNGKIVDSAIENVKLAGMPTATFKGRIAAGTGVPENLTAAQVATILGLWQVAGVYSTQIQMINVAAVVKFQSATSGGSGHGIVIDTVNWRLTVSLTGVYLLTFDCQVGDDFSFGSIIRARVNGVNDPSAVYGPATFPLGMLHVHFLLSLAASDYVDVYVEPADVGGFNFVHYTLLRVA